MYLLSFNLHKNISPYNNLTDESSSKNELIPPGGKSCLFSNPASPSYQL